MSFFCRVATSSGAAEPGVDGGVLFEGKVVDSEVGLVGPEVGKVVARSLDAGSWEPVLSCWLACAAVSLLDLSPIGSAASGSLLTGLAVFDFPCKLDSRPYFCAASSMYSCNFSFKKPLHSVPPCPSKTPK